MILAILTPPRDILKEPVGRGNIYRLPDMAAASSGLRELR
jgi:hypothetical protein